MNQKGSLLIFKIELSVFHTVILPDLMSYSLQIPHINMFMYLFA